MPGWPFLYFSKNGRRALPRGVIGPADEGFEELEVGDVDKFANEVFSGGIEGGMLLVGIDIGEGVRVWGAYGATRGEYGALGDGAVNDDR